MSILRNLAMLLLMAEAANAQPARPEAIVTPMMAMALPDYPGKEALVLTVVYPPGAADPVHRHNAHAFVYVLEGSILTGVRGGEAVTLTPGQTFYEGLGDVHSIGHNASQTESAKFLVILLKNSGEPVAVPVH
jgi:quercetin dioxygenase-like cupin family protein